MTDAIATDLLTPLGAYLRLRSLGERELHCSSPSSRAGFPAAIRSIGSGSRLRLLSYEEAERCGEPVVGYLGYDFITKLEPTVPLPVAGRELPESRFVVAETLVRFDHALGVAEVLRGGPEVVAALEADVPAPPRGRRA